MSKAVKSSRKSRIPRRLKIVGLLLVVALLAAVLIVRHHYNQNLRPVSDNGKVHYVSVKPGSSVGDIAEALYSGGVIRSKSTFEWYVSGHNDRDKLQAGTYGLKPSQSTQQIVSDLVNGKVSTNLVTIVPGQRLDQIKQAFVRSGFKPRAVSSALGASQYRNDYPALADNPPNASLEGFLYPDSYQKTAGTKPGQIVVESLNAMQKHLTPTLRKDFAKSGLTTYQAVTLASIVEQEVADPGDKPQVAQVFLKRLRLNMPLGSDVTAKFGAIKNGKAPSVSYDSAYNTLLHKGLPPGPISTVSDSSLQAVAKPANTDWLYFVSGDDGKTHFSKTLKQHKIYTDRYCHKLCKATQSR